MIEYYHHDYDNDNIHEGAWPILLLIIKKLLGFGHFGSLKHKVVFILTYNIFLCLVQNKMLLKRKPFPQSMENSPKVA